MNTEILSPTDENINKCAKEIRCGSVVAFPTETVYGLGANAFNETAVKKIFEVKGRPSDNPLIVHIASFDDVKKVAAEVPALAQKVMRKFMPGPITVVLKKRPEIPDCVTAGLGTVGVRMPAHAVCRNFLKSCATPVAAPSANLSTRPSPTKASHVLRDLKGKIEYILNGGSCKVGVESTIIDLSGKTPKLLRAGGISKEELQEVCGCEIEIAAGGTVALSPGMKYKHYAPKAAVYFSAYYDGMVSGIIRNYDILADKGNRTVILSLGKNADKYGQRNVYDMGDDVRGYAHNLFASLRRADKDGYDAVIAEGVPSDGIGAAIINRLVKASGGKII